MPSRRDQRRHRRPRPARTAVLRTGVVAGTATAAVLAAGAGASADTGQSGDQRAESYDGNVTSCDDGDKGAGVGGKEYGDDQGGNPKTVVTFSGKAGETYLSITDVTDGFEVLAVAVKGGKNGYNLYRPAELGELPWNNLHAPLNKDKPAAISHFLICVQEVEATTEGGTTPTEEGGSTPTEEGGSTPTEEGGSTPTEEGGSTPIEEGGSTPTEEGGSTPSEEQGTPQAAGEQEDDGDEEAAQAAPPAAQSNSDDGDEEAAQAAPPAAQSSSHEAAATAEVKGVKKDLPKTGGGAEAGLAAVGSLLVGAGVMLRGSGPGVGRHRAPVRRRGAHRRG